MLRIFLYALLPSVHLLWRSVFKSLIHLSIVTLSRSFKFFPCLDTHTLHNCFAKIAPRPPDCSLSFYSLRCVFCRVFILTKSNMIFSSHFYTSCGISERSLPNPKSPRFSVIFKRFYHFSFESLCPILS